MEIEFDQAKDAINRAKHGVSLAFGVSIFGDTSHVVLPSMRPIDGEDRYKVVGLVAGKLWTGVHVYRGKSVRFLSVRRSNEGEQGNYDRASG